MIEERKDQILFIAKYYYIQLRLKTHFIRFFSYLIEGYVLLAKYDDVSFSLIMSFYKTEGNQMLL